MWCLQEPFRILESQRKISESVVHQTLSTGLTKLAFSECLAPTALRESPRKTGICALYVRTTKQTARGVSLLQTIVSWAQSLLSFVLEKQPILDKFKIVWLSFAMTSSCIWKISTNPASFCKCPKSCVYKLSLEMCHHLILIHLIH